MRRILHRPMLILAAAALLAGGCASRPKYPPYSPHENLLSIMTEFTLLSAADPYRDPIGRDLSGANIAKSTLVRLANYESLHPDRLRPEILFAKGRALELAGEFQSARRNFEEAAAFGTEMTTEARRRMEILGGLIIIGATQPPDTDIESLLATLQSQATEFRQFARGQTDPFYQALALREAELADTRRAELMVLNRYILPDGEQQALAALQALVNNHRESARAMQHALRLARYHRELAQTEVRVNPPEGGAFDSARFKLHYDASVELYYRITQADGQPERLLARHELDALLQEGDQVAARAR